ncbi:MAG TPA: sarcosine oxidase subunit delta, partial [Rhodobacteraceae bacterium]|nr:sarcosine oxidase subunit delta [Paracoccaceae bacterium]
MLLLTCPNCGIAAEETELSAGGEAHLQRYGAGSSDDDFETYMFMRKNA